MAGRNGWWRVAAALAVVAVVATACGDDDDDDAGGAAGGGEATTTAAAAGGEATTTPRPRRTARRRDDHRGRGEGGGRGGGRAGAGRRGHDAVLQRDRHARPDPGHRFGGIRRPADVRRSTGRCSTLDPETVEARAAAGGVVRAQRRLHGVDADAAGRASRSPTAPRSTPRRCRPTGRGSRTRPTASPAIPAAAARSPAWTVVDAQTLEITLVCAQRPLRPGGGAAGDQLRRRRATAVAAGHDFTNEPVGAGPFLLEEWIRDDHMVAACRNPDWHRAPTARTSTGSPSGTLYDEEQRSDTFITGDAADSNFTGLHRAHDPRPGSTPGRRGTTSRHRLARLHVQQRRAAVRRRAGPAGLRPGHRPARSSSTSAAAAHPTDELDRRGLAVVRARGRSASRRTTRRPPRRCSTRWRPSRAARSRSTIGGFQQSLDQRAGGVHADDAQPVRERRGHRRHRRRARRRSARVLPGQLPDALVGLPVPSTPSRTSTTTPTASASPTTPATATPRSTPPSMRPGSTRDYDERLELYTQRVRAQLAEDIPWWPYYRERGRLPGHARGARRSSSTASTSSAATSRGGTTPEERARGPSGLQEQDRPRALRGPSRPGSTA